MTSTPATTVLDLQRGTVEGDRLEFRLGDSLERALRDGCFALAIPADLDLGPGLRLCREFYREGDPTQYRGFREQPGVYFDREHFQTEHVLIDGPARSRLFPAELVRMCDQIGQLGLTVLRACLQQLAIPSELWYQVTGGAVAGDGTHWFAANHYRADRDKLGCAPHKDTGFITVLYIEHAGLEASIDGEWWSVDPVPGHFIVNFGGAFELLTAQLDLPVAAILHRVRRCLPGQFAEDRFSFAVFANPPATGSLYQIDRNGRPDPLIGVAEFLQEFNRQTWHDSYDDFGIAASPNGASADRP